MRRRKVASNLRLFISNTDAPGLSTAYYICDVYACNSGNLNIPAGASVTVDFSLMPKYGYGTYAGGSPFKKGGNVNQTQTPNGSTYYLYTYSVVITYTVTGQAVGRTIPQDLRGMQFAYSYNL